MNKITPERSSSFATIFSWIVACLGFLAIGCAGRENRPDYGLLAVEIFVDQGYHASLVGGASAKISVPASVWIAGQRYSIQIEAAGSSTIQAAKKSYDLKFQSQNGISEKTAFRGFSQLRLFSALRDTSQVRTYVAYEIFESTGLVTPWRTAAAVYINDVYQGVYAALEKVEVDFFERRGLDPTRIYEARNNADFSPGMNSRLEKAYTTSPGSDNLAKIDLLLRILWEEDPARFEQNVFRVLDRESTVQYMVGVKLTNHYDGLNKNLRLYSTQENPKLGFLPWDMDLCWLTVKLDKDPWRDVKNHLFTRIGDLPSIRAEIDDRLQTLRSILWQPAQLQSRVEFWRAHIREAYRHDPSLPQPDSYEQETALLSNTITDWIADL